MVICWCYVNNIVIYTVLRNFVRIHHYYNTGNGKISETGFEIELINRTYVPYSGTH